MEFIYKSLFLNFNLILTIQVKHCNTQALINFSFDKKRREKKLKKKKIFVYFRIFSYIFILNDFDQSDSVYLFIYLLIIICGVFSR